MTKLEIAELKQTIDNLELSMNSLKEYLNEIQAFHKQSTYFLNKLKKQFDENFNHNSNGDSELD